MKKAILLNRTNTNEAKEILSLILVFCSDVCFLFQAFLFIDFLSALVLLLYLSWTSNCDSFNSLVPSLTRNSVVSSVILLYCALDTIESLCIHKMNFSSTPNIRVSCTSLSKDKCLIQLKEKSKSKLTRPLLINIFYSKWRSNKNAMMSDLFPGTLLLHDLYS